MDEKELEFSLEDILREFGSGTYPPEEPESEERQEEQAPEAEAEPEPEQELTPDSEPTPEAEEAPAEEDEDFTSPFWQNIRTATESEVPELPVQNDDEHLRIYSAESPEKETAPVNLEETRRFFVVNDQPVVSITDDTIRLDTADMVAAVQKAAMDSGATMVFEPIGNADDSAPEESPVQEIPKGAEPFSKNWEPHYEEPIGEYVPPEPIVFRPRSRLSELKKKLVAGPERRYYALSEEGVGKFQVLLFLNLLVLILASVAVVLHQMGLVQEERMRLLVFGEMFAMLISALLGSDRLMTGFLNIFKGKFNLDSLLMMTFVVSVVECVF